MHSRIHCQAELSNVSPDIARKLLEEMAEVRSLDIVLRTNSGKDIRLRVVGKPEKHLSVLLHQLRLPLPNKAKMLQNVVETLGIN
jgi:hypothetical protein